MTYTSCFYGQLKLWGPYLAQSRSMDILGAGTTLKYLKMFVFPLGDCCLWGSVSSFVLQQSDEAWGGTKHGFMRWFGQGRGREERREGLYPIHLTESRSRCSVCPSPAARQGLFPLPLYCFEPQRWAWLHKSGGNATRPLACASCQVPPFMFFVQTSLRHPSSPRVWVWQWCCFASLCL